MNKTENYFILFVNIMTFVSFVSFFYLDDNHRPYLSRLSSEASDYINAVYVDVSI